MLFLFSTIAFFSFLQCSKYFSH